MKFYTEEEVLLHSIPEDCWISVFDDIFDITALLKSSEGNETKSLFKYAGKSVSHWFNEETGEIKTFVDPLRNVTLPYVPLHEGNILYVPSPDPTTEINIDILPWWKNSSLIVGKVLLI